MKTENEQFTTSFGKSSCFLANSKSFFWILSLSFVNIISFCKSNTNNPSILQPISMWKTIIYSNNCTVPSSHFVISFTDRMFITICQLLITWKQSLRTPKQNGDALYMYNVQHSKRLMEEMKLCINLTFRLCMKFQTMIKIEHFKGKERNVNELIIITFYYKRELCLISMFNQLWTFDSAYLMRIPCETVQRFYLFPNHLLIFEFIVQSLD